MEFLVFKSLKLRKIKFVIQKSISTLGLEKSMKENNPEALRCVIAFDPYGH